VAEVISYDAVPLHLRHAVTALMKKADYGQGFR
jgi:hypothetical protein